MTSAVQPSSHKLWNAVLTGSAIMGLQTPPVTILNRISVISCYHDLPMWESAKMIYQGKADAATQRSVRHFFRGVSGHLLKETLRIGFTAPMLVTKPQLDHRLGTFYGDLTFAAALSVAEIVINPADTLRTMWQAGQSIMQIESSKRLSHLYKGAVANGLRQFGSWLGFPLSERVWSNVLEQTTSLNPHEISGIAVKAIPQSLQIAIPIWMFERLKNELQYHPDISKTFRYFDAFKRIIHSQKGFAGLWRGFIPKILSNAVVVVRTDYLLEQGRKEQQSSNGG